MAGFRCEPKHRLSAAQCRETRRLRRRRWDWC